MDNNDMALKKQHSSRNNGNAITPSSTSPSPNTPTSNAFYSATRQPIPYQTKLQKG